MPGPGLRHPLTEPPAFRAHPLLPEGACVNCGTELRSSLGRSRCWECGRALCVDCYWRHGLEPSDHRCAACAAHPGTPPVTVSGGRAGPSLP